MHQSTIRTIINSACEDDDIQLTTSNHETTHFNVSKGIFGFWDECLCFTERKEDAECEITYIERVYIDYKSIVSIAILHKITKNK